GPPAVPPPSAGRDPAPIRGLVYSRSLTFLACCAHYPGGPIRPAGYRLSALPRRVLPERLSLPRFSAGSAPHWAFRGLLELYTRYGLPSCSPTFLWTLSRGSDPARFPTHPPRS